MLKDMPNTMYAREVNEWQVEDSRSSLQSHLQKSGHEGLPGPQAGVSPDMWSRQQRRTQPQLNRRRARDKRIRFASALRADILEPGARGGSTFVSAAFSHQSTIARARAEACAAPQSSFHIPVDLRIALTLYQKSGGTHAMSVPGSSRKGASNTGMATHPRQWKDGRRRGVAGSADACRPRKKTHAPRVTDLAEAVSSLHKRELEIEFSLSSLPTINALRRYYRRSGLPIPAGGGHDLRAQGEAFAAAGDNQVKWLLAHAPRKPETITIVADKVSVHKSTNIPPQSVKPTFGTLVGGRVARVSMAGAVAKSAKRNDGVRDEKVMRSQCQQKSHILDILEECDVGGGAERPTASLEAPLRAAGPLGVSPPGSKRVGDHMNKHLMRRKDFVHSTAEAVPRLGQRSSTTDDGGDNERVVGDALSISSIFAEEANAKAKREKEQRNRATKRAAEAKLSELQQFSQHMRPLLIQEDGGDRKTSSISPRRSVRAGRVVFLHRQVQRVPATFALQRRKEAQAAAETAGGVQRLAKAPVSSMWRLRLAPGTGAPDHRRRDVSLPGVVCSAPLETVEDVPENLEQIIARKLVSYRAHVFALRRGGRGTTLDSLIGELTELERYVRFWEQTSGARMQRHGTALLPVIMRDLNTLHRVA